MGLITSQLPTIGDPNSTEDVDIRTLLSDLKTLVNGNIDDANASAPSFVGGNAQLYKSLFEAQAYTSALTTTLNTFTTGSASGGLIPSGNTAVGIAFPSFYLDSGDYPILGTKTVRLRVATDIITNNVAPAVTYTSGLHLISASSGASTAIGITLAGIISGSTVTHTTPAANTFTRQVSSSFALPANGMYVFGIIASGAMSGSISIAMKLQYKYV